MTEDLLPMAKQQKSPNTWSAPKFKGTTFAFTGRIKDKKDIEKWISGEAGKLAPNLNDKVTYLVVGQVKSRPSADEQKAKKLNIQGARIQIIEEDDFWMLLRPSREEVLDMLTGGKKGRDRWEQFHPRFDWQLHQRLPIPDLSGGNLSGADLHDLNFHDIKLDGADLRKANLTNSRGLAITGGRLDGACMVESAPAQLIECSLRHVDLRESSIHGWNCSFDRSDLTGAKLDKLFCQQLNAVAASFKNASLREAHLYGSKFAGADFTGSDLTRTDLHEADLSDTKWAGATLTEAILSGANLKNADLRKAVLHNANLAGANLSGARIDGADFTGANVFGARLTGVDVSKAKGLAQAAQTKPGAVGASIKQLDDIARKSASLSVSAKVEQPGKGAPTIRMEIFARYHGNVMRGIAYEGESSRFHQCQSQKLPDIFLEMGSQWGSGQLLFDTIGVDIRKGAMHKKELLPIAVAALCEAFGVSPPSEAERDTARNQARDEFLKLLKKGKKGIEQWNAAGDRLAKAGNFKNVDLADAELANINFYALDFEKTNFTGAVLDSACCDSACFRGANFASAQLGAASFVRGDCSDADFTGANLSKANLGQRLGYRPCACNLRNARFVGADLSEANLYGVDLCGADLSEAKVGGVEWTKAKFDDATRLPKGFRPPQTMKWVGKGARPGLAKAKKAAPVDFDTFLSRLKAHDPIKCRLKAPIVELGSILQQRWLYIDFKGESPRSAKHKPPPGRVTSSAAVRVKPPIGRRSSGPDTAGLLPGTTTRATPAAWRVAATARPPAAPWATTP
jgi:uncharacterized protein YjbI with pentapeptide repeats